MTPAGQRDLSRGRQRASTDAFWPRLVLWIIAAGTLLVPIVVSPSGSDSFRAPKELAFRCTAITAAAALVSSIVFQQVDWLAWRRGRATGILILSIVVWMTVATLASTNRVISISAFGYGLSAVVIFVAAFTVARGRGVLILAASAFAAAIPNAVVAVLQALRIWNPFVFTNDANLSPRLRVTGLLGNPSDAGVFLAICAIPLLGVSLSTTRRRGWAAALTALTVAGLLATQSLTALVALIAAAIAMSVIRWRRRAFVATVGAAAVLAVVLLPLPTVRNRIAKMRTLAAAHKYDEMSSFRLVPFRAAWQLFAAHPISGTGPGTFKWHYLPERLRIEATHPETYLTSTENYGEVHSDHLQLLAEAGLPAYVLFVVALAMLGSVSFVETREESTVDETIRLTALPLAVGIATLSAATFPFELAGCLVSISVLTAIALRWKSDATA